MANDRVEPQSPFYRNKASGGVYPAMTSPSGYEDKNPDDWEPCTDTEIKAERADLAAIHKEKKAARRAESDTAELGDGAAAATAADPALTAADPALTAGPALPGKAK